MSIDKFKINILNQKVDYRPEEEIYGIVTLFNKDPFQIQELQIKFRGETKVRITEKREVPNGKGVLGKLRSSFRSRRKHNDILEDEFNFQIPLFSFHPQESTSIEGHTTIIYEFRSNLRIPPCPTGSLGGSISGNCGSSAYWIEARVIINGGNTISDKYPLSIHPHVSLRYFPDSLRPGFLSSYKKGGFLSRILSGKIGFCVRLPKRGFHPGDYVDFTAEINSSHLSVINLFEIKIIRNAKFRAKGRFQEENVIVASSRAPKLKDGKRKYWQGCENNENALMVPFDASPSSLLDDESDLIHCQYKLMVEMRILGDSEVLSDSTYIFIGNS